MSRLPALAAALLLAAPLASSLTAQQRPASRPAAARPTAAEARAFIARAESTYADLGVRQQRASWVAENFITEDTEELSAEASRALNVAMQRLAMQAKRYDKVALPAAERRKLTILELFLTAPPPADPAKAAELSKITSAMDAGFGRAKYCRTRAGKQECLPLTTLTRTMAESRDPAELLDVWRGWHEATKDMRPKYERYVQLSNEGARGLGFHDVGELWRANYDMTPAQFEAEYDRLWKQVEPLYLALHTYVRTKLGEKYGTQVVPQTGMIPAHLLGNMWAQEWGNIYDVVAPAGSGGAAVDVGALLKAKNVDAKGMARYAEGFFTSLGFDSLPPTFWTRSLFVKPQDRDVVCHASAWDIDNLDDLRVKMCMEQTGEDFVTIHHEEGHNFYQRAYKKQPPLFQNGANDGFHEAIGDAIALAITPKYLVQVGLLDPAKVPSAAGDTLYLLRQAMDKVAFLPFGLLVDKWRWQVFSGQVTPDQYNAAWWRLRNQYQGLSAPIERPADAFDPIAKYHVAANVPYARYFLARLLQFQFYRALCREAGHTGPLYTCTFYGNKQAGAKLARMLEAGQSQPWQTTLYQMTGERDIDASAMVEYFQPLMAWLEKQNAGKKAGWKVE